MYGYTPVTAHGYTQFHKKMSIVEVAFHLDYNLDEVTLRAQVQHHNRPHHTTALPPRPPPPAPSSASTPLRRHLYSPLSSRRVTRLRSSLFVLAVCSTILLKYRSAPALTASELEAGPAPALAEQKTNDKLRVSALVAVP